MRLRCPKCGYTTESERRGQHAPCRVCIVEGRGNVQLMPESAAPAVEQPEAPPLPGILGAVTVLGPDFKWSCAERGHVIVGQTCVHCKLRAPDDYASAAAWREAEARHVAETESALAAVAP